MSYVLPRVRLLYPSGASQIFTVTYDDKEMTFCTTPRCKTVNLLRLPCVRPQRVSGIAIEPPCYVLLTRRG